jgi:hypothetical protein
MRDHPPGHSTWTESSPRRFEASMNVVEIRTSPVPGSGREKNLASMVAAPYG